MERHRAAVAGDRAVWRSCSGSRTRSVLYDRVGRPIGQASGQRLGDRNRSPGCQAPAGYLGLRVSGGTAGAVDEGDVVAPPTDDARREDLRALVMKPIEVAEPQQREIEQLKARLRKDSGNSSKPPSSDAPRSKRRREQRPSSGTKQRGQPGHEGASRRQFDTGAVEPWTRFRTTGRRAAQHAAGAISSRSTGRRYGTRSRTCRPSCTIRTR